MHIAIQYLPAVASTFSLLLLSLLPLPIIALTIEKPSNGLPYCGQTQLRWSGSSGQTDVIVLDAENNTPLKNFLQTPADTFSVTWPVIGVRVNRKIKVQVVDSKCQSAVSEPLSISAGDAVDASTFSCNQAVGESGISITQFPQLLLDCGLNYGESHSNSSSSDGDSSSSSSSSSGGGSSSSSSSPSNGAPTTNSSSSSSPSSPSGTSPPSSTNPAGQANSAHRLLLYRTPKPIKMDALVARLPDGLLPRWLLVVTSLAFANVIGNYLNPKSARRVYAADKGIIDASPLSSRLLAVWNFTSGLIRVYAAYNIQNKQVYELCIGTFLVVLGHFLSELLVYKTATLKSFGFCSALVVAVSSLTAMVLQYDHYVG